VEVAKDRPGFVRGATEGGVRVADLHVGEDANGRLEVVLRPPGAGDLPIAAQRVLEALRTGGEHQTVAQLQERTAHDGHPHPLKTRTVQARLAELEAGGLAEGTEPAPGLARYWSARPEPEPQQ
jgi:hypothetical protein